MAHPLVVALSLLLTPPAMAQAGPRTDAVGPTAPGSIEASGPAFLRANFDDGLQVVVDSTTTVSLHGFARLDYARGSRFPDAVGEDQFGPSKLALETDVEFESFKLVSVLGSTILSDQAVDTGFKDIFLVWKKIGGSEFTTRGGAQATLFGLKPAGYPGDRSLQPSIEFGGAGAFPVSNQAGPSLIVEHPLGGIGRIEVGVFDTSATTSGTAGSLEGSGLYKNYFAQVRLEHVGLAGLYGVVGYEGRYVGMTSAGSRVDETEPILDAGVGFANDLLDLSFEIQSVDEVIAETADTETYLVAELTVFASEDFTAMLDWAGADELGNETLRLGGLYDLNAHTSFHLELAHDEIDGGSDLDSVQARIAFGF